MKLRAVSIGISSGVLLGIAGLLGYFCYDGIVNAVLGSLFFLLFCGTPQTVTIFLATMSRNLFSHILLLTASLLYGAWFVYGLYVAAYDPSSTSALVLLVVGIAALPILIPLWLAVVVPEIWIYRRRQHKQSPNNSET